MRKLSLFCCLALCMVQESIQKPIGYGFEAPMWMFNYIYSSFDYPPSVPDDNNASSGEPQSASAESTDQSDGWQPSSGYPATNLQAPFPIEFSGGNPPYIAQTFICVHPCDPMRTNGS